MFYVLSKIAGVLIEPYYLALTLALVAGLLRLLRRLPRLRRGLLIAAGALLLVFSFGPTANGLLYPLESRYHRPTNPETPPGAVVLLGGMTSRVFFGHSPFELSGAADRLVEALRLAHRYPKAVLLITGGPSGLVDDSYHEADMLGFIARGLGIKGERLRLERQARNTHENARYSKALLGDISGPVLLVTSASHLPRAVACFEKVGQPVVPWPVDFIRTGSGPGSWLPKPETLLRSTVALHEYLGWLAYWWMGYV